MADRTYQPPKVLYKYTTFETAKNILISGKLRLGNPMKQFNDPFDTRWPLDWQLWTKNAISYERLLLQSFLTNQCPWPTNGNPELRIQMNEIREYITTLPEKQQIQEIDYYIKETQARRRRYRDEFKSALNRHRNNFLILCMSSVCDSLLMWSHYASNHTGIVLEFDTKALEQFWKHSAEPVQYKENFPELVDVEAFLKASVFETDHSKIIERYRNNCLKHYLTKNHAWSYENEWRFAWDNSVGSDPKASFKDYTFPHRALRAVILGCDSNDSDALKMKGFIGQAYPQAAVSKMERHPSQFAVTRRKV